MILIWALLVSALHLQSFANAYTLPLATSRQGLVSRKLHDLWKRKEGLLVYRSPGCGVRRPKSKVVSYETVISDLTTTVYTTVPPTATSNVSTSTSGTATSQTTASATGIVACSPTQIFTDLFTGAVQTNFPSGNTGPKLGNGK